MYLSIKVITIFVISLASVVQNYIYDDIEKICKSNVQRSEAYNTFSKLIEFYENEDPLRDCDHSVGFHLTKQFCKQKFNVLNPVSALTAYFTETTKIALIIKFDVKKDKNGSDVTNFIFSIDSNVKYLSQLSSHSFFALIVVWIREPIIDKDFSHNYKISYFSNDGKQNTIQTKDLRQSIRREEQILLKDIELKKKSNQNEYHINITYEVPTKEGKNPQYSVDDSYIVFCLESYKLKGSGNCKPIVIEDHGISCECDSKNQLATIIIMFVFWFIVSILSIRPLITLLTDKREKERTDFPMLISCNQKNSKYEYIICLRLAKASPDFDLKDVNIDVEFLTATNENVAPVFRFRANLLERQLLTQIRIFMWRLTKLPELKKVQCSHSGISDGKIILFGVYIFCRKGGDVPEFKLYRINKSIVRESRMFPMIRGDVKDDKVFEDEEKQVKSLANFPINYSFLEKVWIFFVIISLIAFTAAIFPLNWLFGSGNGSLPVILKMLVLTSISSLVAIIFSIAFICIYRFLILSELRQQAKMNSSCEKIFFVLIRVYYIISIIVSVILGLFISFQKTRQKTVDTYKWFCVTFCATAFFALVWVISSHLTIFPTQKVPTEPSEDLEDTSHSNLGSETSQETVPNDKRV